MAADVRRWRCGWRCRWSALLLLGNLLVAVATRSAPQLGAMAIGPAALLLGFVWALPLLFEA